MVEVVHLYKGASDDVERSVLENPHEQLYGANEVIEQRNFGVKDSKGRVVGGRVSRITLTTTPVKSAYAEKSWRMVIEPGVYHTYEPSATRNGALFGASQRRRWFTTEAECQAAIEKYFSDAAKRAAKLYPKTVM